MNNGALRRRWGWPPFSVFDSSDLRWHREVERWRARIDSLAEPTADWECDPFFTELQYRWFSATGSIILDPFAMEPIAGIVASLMGRQYIGLAVDSERAAAHQRHADRACDPRQPRPRWLVHDASTIEEVIHRELGAGFAPDYIYSFVGRRPISGLSDSRYEQYCADFKGVVVQAISILKPDRFGMFVVGDSREACEAFERAGVGLYNRAILITPASSLPQSFKLHFSRTRQAAGRHLEILGFVKGSPRIAAQYCSATDQAALG